MTDETPNGARHPLCTSDSGNSPWEVSPELHAWTADGNVILQGPDGDVTVPRDSLPKLARALLAAHVTNGRMVFEVRA